MPSVVDICNLALSHIGDSATVSSINPPEGSAQAQHCAKFYPIARDSLLLMHQWTFSIKRTLLSELENPITHWKYCYAIPSDMLGIVAVLPSDATNDYSMAFSNIDNLNWNLNNVPGAASFGYVPQAYSLELDSSNDQVIYTNQQNALLKYTSTVTDPTLFSPNFVVALSHILASYLAGAIIKGDVGIKVGSEQLKIALGYVSNAREDDANHGKNIVNHIVPWAAGR